MTPTRWSRWQLSILFLACTSAATIALAAAPARGPARPATTTPAVSAANKTAAIEHFKKAKEMLYTQNNPQDAYAENENALQLDPTNADALLLKRVLQTKLADTVPDASSGSTGQTVAVSGRLKTLTSAQMSVIRLLESKPEEKLRGSVTRKVLDEFWENVAKKDVSRPDDISQQAYQNFVNPSNFSAAAHRIADARNMKYIEQVSVTSDPASLVAFRNGVHSYALQNCATSECHGGEKGGPFRLITGSLNPDAVYTNFYIMTMFAAKSGGRMIDRDTPEKSLFLQYSLPKNLAQFTHTGKVDPRKLASTADARFKAMSEWIKMLEFPRPIYGITYEVPGTPTPAPATQATTTTRPR